MKTYTGTTFVVLLLAATPIAYGQSIPAFPGADGAAAYVSGGRDQGAGQIVYHVTKLDSAIDDPERFDFGTLRYGLQNSNFPTGVPRTIVFDVGGVFNLGRLPQTGWDPNGNGWDAQSRLTIGGTNVTLAGQTAPGAGVIFMGGGLKPQGDNNVIRNITVASGYGMRNWWGPGDPFPDEPEPMPSSLGPGIFPDATVFDAMDISATNLMIDHVSTLYATDETISMNEASDNITVQYSNISQSQNYPQWDAEGPGRFTGHALGSLLEAGDQAAISFHHNLYAHHKSRVPQAQGAEAYYDFRNNVFYNWFGTAGASNGSTRMNLVNNFYLAGNGGDDPVGGQNTGITQESGGTSVLDNDSSVYGSGNLRDINKDGDANDGIPVGGAATNPFWSGGVVTYAGATDTAEDAYDRVLDYVGANWWTRDGVVDTPDERIINETRTGTGKVIAWADDPWDNDPNEGTEWRNLVATPQTTRAADWDTEADVGYGVGDGMPTYWELQHGLDPSARDDAGDFDNDGYTNLEEYLNDVAAWPAANAITFNNANGDGRFAHILNWDANPDSGSVHPWQPSRYDTAVISTGTVIVDSVGQHAGNLLLGTSAGNSVNLNITAGWLIVEDAEHGLSDGMTVIGDHPSATAALNLSGGKLVTKMLLKGDGGSFTFTGGTLVAETVGFDLANDGGTIAPADAEVGRTIVFGDFGMSAGTVELDLAGVVAGMSHDQIIVDGDISLSGGLSLVTPNDWAPAYGETAVLIGGTGQLSGLFDSVQGMLLSSQQSVAVIYEASEVSAVVALPGDANLDGTVDGQDFVIWNTNKFSGGKSWETGDFNGDGTVDGQDFVVWNSNKFTSVDEIVAVPEPIGWSVGLLLVLGSFRRRVRSRFTSQAASRTV